MVTNTSKANLPSTERLYRSHSLDSARWNRYSVRLGDVIVVSAYKSGTTWIQLILLRMLHGTSGFSQDLRCSPWLESPMLPLDDMIATLEAQPHRRLIKTHLPLDGCPYHQQARYIVICRDPRDVFMSLWNHYSNLIRYPSLAAPVHPFRVGPPLPRCPEDIRDFWRQWLTRGWFEWEREGYPFWSNLRHTQTWWDWKHLSNVYFVHFNNLLADFDGQVRAIADHIGIALDSRARHDIAQATTFEQLRKNADALLPDARAMFRGGASTFFHMGTNGRWRDVLREEDLELYRDVARRELTDACRQWLENGR